MRIIIFLLFIVPATLAEAQDVTAHFPTENTTNRRVEKKKKNAPKARNIRYITKNKGQGLLYGNPCMVEQTRRMGFEYVIQTPGLPGTLKPWKRYWENFKTSAVLTLTKSPFWKTILNGRVKNCRKKSGDLVG